VLLWFHGNTFIIQSFAYLIFDQTVDYAMVIVAVLQVKVLSSCIPSIYCKIMQLSRRLAALTKIARRGPGVAGFLSITNSTAYIISFGA
jgi:hypothetical protein